ncbi:hypothetical protein LCGC14_2648840, partial [marine sediment metagenome]
AVGNVANLTLPTPGSGNSLGDNKDIIIDSISPRIINVNSTKPDGFYGIGVSINITVTFNETVYVIGTPQLSLETGSADGWAYYIGGDGTDTLIFNYTVALGHDSTDLNYNSSVALILNGGTIMDGVGRDAILTLPILRGAGSLFANRDIMIDGLPPSGTISINDGAFWTNSVDVVLNFSAYDTISGVDEVRFRNANGSWTSWEPAYPTPRSWSLPSIDGNYTVIYQIRDYALNWIELNDTIGLDVTLPSGSILINSSADTNNFWTTSISVSLILSFNDTGPDVDAISGVFLVRYRNEDGTWSPWEDANTTKAWPLSEGDGWSKIVYYQIEDKAGNIAQFNDTINLDTTAPIIIGNLPIGYYWSGQPVISVSVFDLTLDDIWYEVGSYTRSMSNNTEILLDNVIWNSLDNGEFIIYIRAGDDWGHICDAYVITLYKDTLAPSLAVSSPGNN